MRKTMKTPPLPQFELRCGRHLSVQWRMVGLRRHSPRASSRERAHRHVKFLSRLPPLAALKQQFSRSPQKHVRTNALRQQRYQRSGPYWLRRHRKGSPLHTGASRGVSYPRRQLLRNPHLRHCRFRLHLGRPQLSLAAAHAKHASPPRLRRQLRLLHLRHRGRQTAQGHDQQACSV
jgi:hypothetical protein